MFNEKKWDKELRNVMVKRGIQEYKMNAGLKYDEKLIKKLDKNLTGLSQEVLKNKVDRSLFLNCLDLSLSDKLGELNIEFYKNRNKVIKNKYCNWSSWRQFASNSKDPKLRKDVFDDFLKKSVKLKANVKKRTDIVVREYDKYNLNVVDSYCEQNFLSKNNLKRIINELNVKKQFNKEIEKFMQEKFNKPFEYYDDLYYVRNVLFDDFNIKNDPVKECTQVFKKMGFDLKKIKIDNKNRRNKTATACCFGIDPGKDVRIMYKKENGINDFSSVFHELGHAVHFDVMDNPLWWKRSFVPNSVAEVFSILTENIFFDKFFLNKYNLDINLLDKRRKLNEMYFLAFYVPNSLVKIEYWEGKIKFDEISSRYSELIKEYMGVDLNGNYWLLHHILPEEIIYCPSYIIASVRVFELINILKKKYGNEWWNNKESGNYLRELMRSGVDIDLGFSRLDTSYFRSVFDK
ncbi:hypothetical protein J4436_00065 [Candidatus Woesearchaeota archaeon]|nr:hypothetical protein [Candidatus Woesearchaeota archaeon]